MRKRNDWFYELVFIVLCVIAVLALFAMMRNSLSSSGDTEILEIMDEAQERIDAYHAAVEAQLPQIIMVVYTLPEPEAGPEIQEIPEEPEVPPVEDWYIETIPLDKKLQEVVWNSCGEYGVDYFTALGLIQVESNFQVDAVNSRSGCYGLMQLNPHYFPTGLTPKQNIEFGCGYLGELIERYKGDVEAALTAFNAGHDTGHRWYARAVLEATDSIMDTAGVMTD